MHRQNTEFLGAGSCELGASVITGVMYLDLMKSSADPTRPVLCDRKVRFHLLIPSLGTSVATQSVSVDLEREELRSRTNHLERVQTLSLRLATGQRQGMAQVYRLGVTQHSCHQRASHVNDLGKKKQVLMSSNSRASKDRLTWSTESWRWGNVRRNTVILRTDERGGLFLLPFYLTRLKEDDRMYLSRVCTCGSVRNSVLGFHADLNWHWRTQGRWKNEKTTYNRAMTVNKRCLSHIHQYIDSGSKACSPSDCARQLISRPAEEAPRDKFCGYQAHDRSHAVNELGCLSIAKLLHTWREFLTPKQQVCAGSAGAALRKIQPGRNVFREIR
ncbi:hypothetical protein RRG08_008083 [Elysia crispata]|uniref:Uncharacterized protein n=1 Tax=Elysia crispata TaxID=231223 RepID=A0AAE0Y1D3_9GAST|nr:hypothetical protein RRG08_008083 [Elysia crispata]